MPKVTPKVDTEKLIALVRQHGIIYDITDPNYVKARNMKTTIWDNIAKELGSDGMTCKLRWNSVRDQYRKSLKRTVTRSRKEPEESYRYHESLSFLRPFFEQRDRFCGRNRNNDESITDATLDNTSQDSDRSEPSSVLECQIDIKPDTVISTPNPSQKSIILPQDEIHNTNQNSPPHLSIDQALELLSTLSSRSNATSQDTIQKQNSAATALLQYLLKKKQDDVKEDHPIDKFLQGIAPTIKSFTPYYQNIVKSEIFNLVQKYEILMLTRDKEEVSIEMDNKGWLVIDPLKEGTS